MARENGHFLTTKETKQQRRTAETMLRFTNGTDAAQIVPMTGDEAWAKEFFPACDDGITCTRSLS